MSAKQDVDETTVEEVETPRKVVRKKWTAQRPQRDDASPEEQPAERDDASSEEKPAERDEAEAEATRSAPEVPGGKGVWARVVGAVAAMAVVALAATAVLQWMSADQSRAALAKLETDRQLRLEVSGAAQAFGTALLSYDYQDLQTTRTKLTAMATGDFLATYDEAFGGAMAQVIVKLKAVSAANVREIYLADVDDATAHAIVVVDQQVKTSEAIRSVKDSHLKITLVKQKGAWKIQDVTVLGAAKEDQYNLDGTKADQKKK